MKPLNCKCGRLPKLYTFPCFSVNEQPLDNSNGKLSSNLLLL